MDVFISRPTWVSATFRKGLDNFLTFIRTLDLNPRTVGVTDHPVQTPLDEVISVMRLCRGAIILGYPQIDVLSGKIKESLVENPISLATEWNHIEAGIAYAYKIPLLVIHHKNVIRGVFDRGAINKFIYSKDFSDASWFLAEDTMGAINKWKKEVLENIEYQEAIISLETAYKSLICPNCSSNKKSIFLSPLAVDFVNLENATHECSTCGFKLPKR